MVVVQKQRNLGSELSASAAAAQKVRRGDISHAVVVRTKKKYGRPDGSFVRFDDNACVLINKAGDPMGTRLNGAFCGPCWLWLRRTDFIRTGVVAQELRGKQWSKILSLAPTHV